MTPSSAITQSVTNVSGTIAVASTSTSMGVTKVMTSAPINSEHLVYTAQQVITYADIIGLFSAIVLAVSFIYNICAARKKRFEKQNQLDLDNKFYQLRKEELELEKAKFKELHI